MKFKTLFQVFTLLALVFSVFGASQQVQAKADLAPLADPVILSHDMTVWNAIYPGAVSASLYEEWSFTLTESTSFVVTVTKTSGDLIPLISLLDVNKNEVSTLAGSLDSTQPAGKYYLLIKPQSGSGNYNLILRKADPASLSIVPSSVEVGKTAVVTVKLNNIPAEGYTSAEFTCTYDPVFVEVSNITEKGLFGADAVTALNGPANGKFIFAIAGSNGKKATVGGNVFTFDVKALKVGQTSIACVTRVSTGNKTLTEIASTSATLTIIDSTGTLAGKVIASKPVTVSVKDANNVVTPVTVNTDGTFSQSLKVGTYTVTACAAGFLCAEGPATITSGNTTTMPTISLLAGDIDGNKVIDSFDAMTIGMSYNTATPAAADLNNDGTINVLDLELLAANYHKTGPTLWQ